MGIHVSREDPSLVVEDIKYPGETGEIKAHYARPKGDGKHPGVVVIPEIWGLNAHIEDVARRFAAKGYLAIAPDPLSPMGGSPEDGDVARGMVRELDPEETTKNLVAAVEYLKTQPQASGKVGVTGFCWGGGMTNQVAVHSDVEAAAPFYGRQPASEEVSKIKAYMQIHYAGDDERINAGIPEFEAAMKEAGVEHVIHMYEGAKHAFFNDTSERYHEEAAKLAWKRMLALFDEKLKT